MSANYVFLFYLSRLLFILQYCLRISVYSIFTGFQAYFRKFTIDPPRVKEDLWER